LGEEDIITTAKIVLVAKTLKVGKSVCLDEIQPAMLSDPESATSST